MPVTIVGNNTPTAGGVVYGDGTNYASTSAGSSGGVLYSAGSSSPAFTTAGTSGQVLQSNGASAPSWATPAAGATVFLSSVTASNSATVDVESTFNSTYDVYMITASGVTVGTDAVDFLMRMKIGGTYLTASYKVVSTKIASNDANTFVGTSSSSEINSALGVGNAAGEFTNGVFYIFNPSSTSIYKSLQGNMVTCNSTGNAVQSTISAFNESSTSALTGVRFYCNIGNIATGTFRLYGIKNS